MHRKAKGPTKNLLLASVDKMFQRPHEIVLTNNIGHSKNSKWNEIMKRYVGVVSADSQLLPWLGISATVFATD